MTEQAEVIESDNQHHELSDDQYSEAVRKRIGKEVGKRKSLEADLDHANESFHTAQEETANWRKRAEEAEARFDSSEGDRLKRAKVENREKLKQAFEDGDTDKQAEYTEQFSKLNNEGSEHERRQEAKVKQKENPKEEKVAKKIHASAEAFLGRSKDWFDVDEKATKRAIAIEDKLRKEEGFELGDDLYEELEARLFKEMPELDSKGIDDEDGLVETEIEEELEAPKKEVPTVTPSSRGQGRHQRRRSSGEHMSASAQETMRKYGLDPKNPNDIKGFLKHHKGVV